MKLLARALLGILIGVAGLASAGPSVEDTVRGLSGGACEPLVKERGAGVGRPTCPMDCEGEISAFE